jgi:arylsulfatase A-like enzyme
MITARRIALAGIVALCVVLFVLVQTATVRRQGGAAPESSKPAASKQPNVVLLVLDALRADRIGAERNGVPITPTLERFSEASLNFAHAVSPASWTKPAIASLFTSLYPDAHQVYYAADDSNPDQLLADALPAYLETMASFLKKAGYSTSIIVTNGNLVTELGFAQGFDHYAFQNNATADWVTDLAIKEGRELKEPFFLYAHYMEPHAPYDPPERYRTVFGPLPELSPAEQDVVGHSMDYLIDQAEHFWGVRETRRWPDLSPQGRETLRILYDGDCRFMDDKLAELFAFLDTERENTLIIVVADHGEEFWERGSMGHGSSVYQEQIAVPFFIHGPGIPARVCDTPVETLHILPTVAAYLGIEASPVWQGRSLLTDRAESQPVYSTTYGDSPRMKIHTSAVIVGSSKLIVNSRRDAPELYNLAADPQERRDLAATYPEKVAEMRRLLEEHLRENLRHRKAVGLPQTVSLPRELQEQLEAIGYVGTDGGAENRVRLDSEMQERLKSLGYLE